MQTFLPYPSIYRSAIALDYKRHGKQRVEAMQIYLSLQDPSYGWQYHPAVNMWRNYDNALALYHNIMILTWIGKGYRNSMQLLPVTTPVVLPHWFGNEDVHYSHRSKLVQKDPDYYIRQFGWVNRVDYVWPKGG